MRIIGIALALAFNTAASAQTNDYPSRAITLVVTAAAGGVTDAVARAFGQKLTEATGQPVLVENKGGAAHVTGATAVARATPDGYTLLVAEAGTFTINPAVYAPGKLTYDADKDFAAITGLVKINQALLVSKDLPVKDAAELIALAKQKPGQLNFGTAGVGSAPHMNIELLKYMTGVSMQPVHYRGAAPALTDLIAGLTSAMSVSVSLALPPARAGSLKILGIGSEQRLPQAADIPTVSESGLPGYEATTWFGLFAPAGTSREIVLKLNDAARKVFDDREFNRRFMEPQMFQSLVTTPEQFEAFIRRERDKWAKVIAASNIRIE